MSCHVPSRPPLGERVLIPANMLRHGEGVFLDDYTVEQVEQALVGARQGLLLVVAW